MTKNVQNVRQDGGTAATFIGLLGQFIHDLALNVIRVHDGATPGGFPMLGAENNLSDIASAATARTNLSVYSKAEVLALAITPGLLFGGTISNNVVTPNTKMDIGTGYAADSTNVIVMPIAAGTIDTTTTGANGLDVGTTLSASTTYHFYVIMKADLTQSLLASLDPAAPTMPSGYIYKRNIGSIPTDGSSHFIPFTQVNDEFMLTNSNLGIVSATPPDTASHLVTIPGLPTGIKVRAIVDYALDYISGGVSINGYVRGAAQTGGTGLSATVYPSITHQNVQQIVRSDTSGRLQFSHNSVNCNYSCFLRGWINERGRLS